MKKTLMAALGVAACALGAAPPAQAVPLTLCGIGVAVEGGNTSCAFADNVWAQFTTRPGPYVPAYSPATNLSYVMHCMQGYTVTLPSGAQQLATRCAGGEDYNAVVWIW